MQGATQVAHVLAMTPTDRGPAVNLDGRGLIRMPDAHDLRDRIHRLRPVHLAMAAM